MQMEIISDLRERKLQVRTEERQGGYGTELLNNTAVEGIVGPAELSVDGEVQYTFSFGEKETLTEYLKKEKLDEKKLLRLYRQFLEKNAAGRGIFSCSGKSDFMFRCHFFNL